MAAKIDQYRKMKIEDLVEMRKDVDIVIQEKREAATADFKKEMEEKAKALGIDLSSVFGGTTKRRGPKTRSSATIKYRDPKNPANVWSGRGRPAKWLAEYMEKGKKKEDFLVE
jgi:DNA-binding protein H-NS